MSATTAPTTTDPQVTATSTPLPEQHPLALSVLLHLFPGVALTVFVLLLAPVLAPYGVPAPFVLFLGIPLVIVPLELGYLLWHAKRTTGSFRLRAAIDYRERYPARKVAVWSAGLVAWFLVFFTASTVLLDDWLAETFFAWLPDAILAFSTFEDGGVEPTRLVMIGVVVIAFVFNGVVGPVTEELYFRGHLLPRIERLGRWAPVLNTVLFSLYHLWTPWQNPARIVGFLPIAWVAQRKRSVQVAIAVHVTVNLIFLVGLFAAIAAGVAA
jgi:uncharacterized protein